MQDKEIPKQLYTNQEHPVNSEDIDPHSVALATITFFPGWQPGEVSQGQDMESKIRGDIGLQTLREAKENGYQVLVVDGGSSNSFKEALTNLGVVVRPQLKKGYSAGRQQSYTEASQLDGAKIILSTEAEKFSVIHDCLFDDAIKPLLQGDADIVLLKRDEQAFATYPPEQVVFEKKANKLWNDIMKKHGLLFKDAEDLDIWFGPRLFRNDPAIVNYFLQNYAFEKRDGNKLDQITEPSTWSNALFLPIAVALHDGAGVGSFTVPYRHPTTQTAMESHDSKFIRRRDVQYKSILRSTMHLIRLLEANPKSRLTKI